MKGFGNWLVYVIAGSALAMLAVEVLGGPLGGELSSEDEAMKRLEASRLQAQAALERVEASGAGVDSSTLALEPELIEVAPPKPIARLNLLARTPGPHYHVNRRSREVAYGSDIVIECVPGYVCLVVLGDKPAIGKAYIGGGSKRWGLFESAAGVGSEAVPFFVISPTQWGLSGNLVVATDQGVFTFGLETPVEPSEEHEVLPVDEVVLVVGAEPPGEGSIAGAVVVPVLEGVVAPSRFGEGATAEEAMKPAVESAEDAADAALPIMNHRYREVIPRKRAERFNWRVGSRGYDDGVRAYIPLPKAAGEETEEPQVLGLDEDGQEVRVAYRIERSEAGQVVVVERLLAGYRVFLGGEDARRFTDIVRRTEGK